MTLLHPLCCKKAEYGSAWCEHGCPPSERSLAPEAVELCYHGSRSELLGPALACAECLDTSGHMFLFLEEGLNCVQ